MHVQEKEPHTSNDKLDPIKDVFKIWNQYLYDGLRSRVMHS